MLAESCKRLSTLTQLGLASAPPALLIQITDVLSFNAVAESCRVYPCLQEIRMTIRSLTLSWG